MVQQPPPPPPPPPPFFFAANAMPISWFQSSGLVKFHVAHQSCFSSESPHGVSADQTNNSLLEEVCARARR